MHLAETTNSMRAVVAALEDGQPAAARLAQERGDAISSAGAQAGTSRAGDEAAAIGGQRRHGRGCWHRARATKRYRTTMPCADGRAIAYGVQNALGARHSSGASYRSPSRHWVARPDQAAASRIFGRVAQRRFITPLERHDPQNRQTKGDRPAADGRSAAVCNRRFASSVIVPGSRRASSDARGLAGPQGHLLLLFAVVIDPQPRPWWRCRP